MIPSRDPLKAALAAVSLAREIEASTACLAMLSKSDFAPEWVAQEIAEPQFGRQKLISDWRNYVPDPIRDVWNTLPIEARVVAYLMAFDAGAGVEEED